MRGIILAGGTGSRLFPMTLAMSKQMLPVYDKPMIYYPLSMLMLADIKDILVISDPVQIDGFKRLLGSGEKWGVNFSYRTQNAPRGIAEAFLLGKEFIGDDPVSLILGDNIFYGHQLPQLLRSASDLASGAKIFAYEVREPERYGVVEFDDTGKVLSLDEKPNEPKSMYAVPGLYFYDNRVVEFAESLKPSDRGELEITDINNIYLNEGSLQVEVLGRGVAWLDAGTSGSLLQASQFVQTVQTRQGMMISCIEEIAFQRGFIGLEQLIELINDLGHNEYRDYLMAIYNKESKING